MRATDDPDMLDGIDHASGTWWHVYDQWGVTYGGAPEAGSFPSQVPRTGEMYHKVACVSYAVDDGPVGWVSRERSSSHGRCGDQDRTRRNPPGALLDRPVRPARGRGRLRVHGSLPSMTFVVTEVPSRTYVMATASPACRVSVSFTSTASPVACWPSTSVMTSPRATPA